MKVRKIMKVMYQTTPKKQDPHKINRIAYIAEAAFEYFISLLITGAFLAAILTNINVPDSVVGITSSLASLGFLAQAASVLFLKLPGKKKKTVTIMHLVNQLMFVTLYVIPFIRVPHNVKVAAFIIMFLGGHFISNAVSPFKISWLMSYVPDKKRGRFTANKEIISLLGGMIFSYIMGAIIDRYNALGNSRTGFLLSALTILTLAILHLISLLAVKEDNIPSAPEEKKISAKDVISNTLLNKNMRRIILLNILWQFGTGISTSFFGTYQINELGFSLKYVAILSALYSIVRVIFSRFFGKFADKHSWADMLFLSFSIGACGFLVNTFTTPANGTVFYALYYMIYAIYMAGTNSGIMNITFDYASHENRAAALGISSAFGGCAGFLASLLGAKILSAVQANGNAILSHTVYAQQILSFVTFLIFSAVVIYIKMVIVKMKRIDE